MSGRGRGLSGHFMSYVAQVDECNNVDSKSHEKDIVTQGGLLNSSHTKYWEICDLDDSPRSHFVFFPFVPQFAGRILGLQSVQGKQFKSSLVSWL